MNIKETAITNADNLSLFMVNFAQLLLRHFRTKDATVYVLDFKANFRGHRKSRSQFYCSASFTELHAWAGFIALRPGRPPPKLARVLNNKQLSVYC